MTDIVLVHGTTQTAAGFTALINELTLRGYRGMAVDVPSSATATSEDLAELLAAQLPDDLDQPVVLAHSGAGLLLPALARRLRARHQVWLAAVVADFAARRSFLAEVRADPEFVFKPAWIGVDPVADPVLATYFLFHDADLGSLRIALSTLATCDLSAVYGEVPTADPAHISSSYLLPTQDRTFQQTWMRRIATDRLNVEPIPVHGGHNCYAAHPAATAEAIIRAIETALR